MAKIYSKSEGEISKTQRRAVVGYRPKRGDTDTPALNLSGKWLREAGFETGKGVTVKISDGCIVLMVDTDEVRELREDLYKVQLAVQGMRSGMRDVMKGN